MKHAKQPNAYCIYKVGNYSAMTLHALHSGETIIEHTLFTGIDLIGLEQLALQI